LWYADPSKMPSFEKAITCWIILNKVASTHQ
jgi:hypothetical protein